MAANESIAQTHLCPRRLWRQEEVEEIDVRLKRVDFAPEVAERYDLVLLAVPHREYLEMGPERLRMLVAELQEGVETEYARQFMAALRRQMKAERNDSAIQAEKTRLLGSGG